MDLWFKAFLKRGGFVWFFFGVYVLACYLMPSLDVLSIVPFIKDMVPVFIILDSLTATTLNKKIMILSTKLRKQHSETDSEVLVKFAELVLANQVVKKTIKKEFHSDLELFDAKENLVKAYPEFTEMI